jgi:hypothetical protein
MSETPAKWKCQNRSCPDRKPIESDDPLNCYTCGKVMLCIEMGGKRKPLTVNLAEPFAQREPDKLKEAKPIVWKCEEADMKSLAEVMGWEWTDR